MIVSFLEKMKTEHHEGRFSDRHYVGLYLTVRHFDRFQRGIYGSQRVETGCSRWRTSGGAGSLAWEQKLNHAFLNQDCAVILDTTCAEAIFCSCFQDLRFRFISHGAQLTWHAWSKGEYPLTLIHNIPATYDMLTSQARGQRWISLLHQKDQHETPIERFSDAFEFLVHDLEHAYHFFSKPTQYFAQVGFYARMHVCLGQGGLWPSLNLRDPIFHERLNYALSDMNSHVWHLVQYVNAISIEALLRSDKTSTLSNDSRTSLKKQWNAFYKDCELTESEFESAERVTAHLSRYGQHVLENQKVSRPTWVLEKS